ncbi:hypothetical protein CNMCM5793_000748 [Aspergillus hiratsukae]|uniref:Uncharacterized protein n=1 Tax=Aspergillus hiratsukae TaxID=1194566 RepID=A0A8H6Q5L4_9EURO|nr:hypothetical protein CNMCM5793_000748 [Aspergillus hiratsukae]KAF7166119.1 hypothetical protein CNMCM6106_002077 [Aspergillus hiratsukae]
MFWFSIVCALNGLVAYASPTYANRTVSTGGISALYTMTNNAPNNLVAYPVYHETQLGNPKSFYTGGNGGVSRNSTSGGIGVPALVSGHSIVVSANHIFNVNAGSNSITMFEIAKNDSTLLRRIGVFDTPGDFPVTIAIRNSTICVGHSGSRPGVSCAEWNTEGISEFDDLRTVIKETHRPSLPDSNFGSSVLTDLLFTSDGSNLVASVSGYYTESQTGENMVRSWLVEPSGQVATEGTILSTGNHSFAFSGTVIAGTSKIFLTDPKFGGYTVDAQAPASPAALAEVEGAEAACWAQIDPRSGLAYITDDVRNLIVAVDPKTGKTVRTVKPKGNATGYVDFEIVGHYMYTLVNRNELAGQIAVLDLDVDEPSGQEYPIVGSVGHSQGLAVYG